jgi:hypothetical protein
VVAGSIRIISENIEKGTVEEGTLLAMQAMSEIMVDRVTVSVPAHI